MTRKLITLLLAAIAFIAPSLALAQSAGNPKYPATGGNTPRGIQDWLATPLNALGQSVVGDGTTDDSTNLLNAANAAASLGRQLFLPKPASNYHLSSDWKPPVQDTSLRIDPGVTFTGSGQPKMDNAFYFMVDPIFSPVLESRTFGSYYSGYGNVLLHSDVAVNNGAGNTVAGYFEGVSMLDSSHSWGTNPVCITNTLAATCIGEEIDTFINNSSGGNGYGLVINVTGHGNGLNGLQIGGDHTGTAWLNGIDLIGTKNGGTSFTNSAITDSFNDQASFGLNLVGTYTSAEINTQSLRVNATQSVPTSRLVITGGNNGGGITLAVGANQGGSPSLAHMVLQAMLGGNIYLQGSNGRILVATDPGTAIADYAFLQAAPANGQVILGINGSDALASWSWRALGSGGFFLQNGNGVVASFSAPTAATINTFFEQSAPTGGFVIFGTQGGDADVTANLRMAGAGSFIVQNGGQIIAQFSASTSLTGTRFAFQAGGLGNIANITTGGTGGTLTLGSGVLANNFTTGGVGLPTTSGVPTGTVGGAGNAVILINNTSHKICHSEGGGTWFDAEGAACS